MYFWRVVLKWRNPRTGEDEMFVVESFLNFDDMDTCNEACLAEWQERAANLHVPSSATLVQAAVCIRTH